MRSTKIIAKDSVRISRDPQLPAESLCNSGDVHPVKFRNPDKAVPIAVVSHKSEREAEQDVAGGSLVETVGVVTHFKVVVNPPVPRIEFPDASPSTYPQVVPVAAQRADVGWKVGAEEMQSVVRSVKVEQTPFLGGYPNPSRRILRNIHYEAAGKVFAVSHIIFSEVLVVLAGIVHTRRER